MSGRLVAFVVAAIVLLLVAVGVMIYVGNKDSRVFPGNSNTSSQISGTLDINGVVPDGATVSIMQKNFGENGQSKMVVSNIPATDGTAWSVDNLKAGKAYELQARIISSSGNVLSSSSPLVVSAPATDELLVVNVSSSSPSGSAIISGNIQVNGYIPDGATISVLGRKLGADSFTTVGANLAGEKRQFMSYTTAVAGQTYEVYGVLYDKSRKQIGSSSILVITAPALDELLTINSQAIAPQTPTPTQVPTKAVTGTASPTNAAQPTQAPAASVISGSINFNGVAPANSRIVVFQKIYNSGSYQVAADNITPVNGSTWQWNGAAQSTWYDLIAVLKQRQPNGTDQDLATSPMISVAAPASSVVLTINSSISIPAPSGGISVACGNLSGSTWNAQISFNQVPSAQSYWLQVGSSNGSSNLLNVSNNSTGSQQQTISAQLQNGTTYYARYAYSFFANSPVGSNTYSPFSNSTPITCSQ